MNLLIGLVILLCLVCSEIQTAQAATDIWTRVIFVTIITMMVPGLALFQTLVVSRKIRNSELEAQQQENLLRRLSVCHSAVWLAASLAIIWSVRWQDVVRGNWGLDHWPLVDEFFILAPVVFSLVASWAIFYEIQRTIRGKSSQDTKFGGSSFRPARKELQSRLSFVAIRFRVYFLLVLIPISIAVLARDVSPWVQSLAWMNQYLVLGFSTLALILGAPFLLLLVWRNKPIADESLKSELSEVCQRHKIHVHDIRIWQTSGQIVNALVCGLIPKFRVILLSDALIQYFPKNELLAIVRHEAAHLRLWHLPTRIGFAILPLLALAIDEQNPYGVIHFLNHSTESLGLVNGSGLAIVLAAYLSYIWFGFSWISHNMEFEADIYAARSDEGQFEHAQDVIDALLRLAAFSPNQFEKRSMMHPSIAQRIQLVQDIEANPRKAVSFMRAFTHRRRIVLGALTLLAALSLFAL